MESGAFYVYQSPTPPWKLISVSSIAAGVQFAWALQISLLIPFLQTLGVPHGISALVWLYGSFSGMVLQPILGYKSDRCTSRFGRRRPFIAGGAALACLSFLLIGFAKDIGYQAGDSLDQNLKPRAVVVFVLGFWLLDVANNTLQGPCRALLADLCFQDHGAMRTAMSWFSFFMAVGNVLGYAAGAFARLHKFLPFTRNEVCSDNCANLKACFIIAVVILLVVTLTAIFSVSEVQMTEELVRKQFNNNNSSQMTSFLMQLMALLHSLKNPMRLLMLVTFLTWLSWFPFMLFGTDWVGKEVFGGKVDADGVDGSRYEVGVRSGSLGLMVNSMVVAFASLAIGRATRLVRGMKNLWGVANLILAGGLIGAVVITKRAGEWRSSGAADASIFPPLDILWGTWIVYLLLGISLAVQYSIPFAMASIYCSITGGGQGLSLGVLNLAIIIPQMIVSVGCGPLEAFFGSNNAPSFELGAVVATISAIVAIFVLPDPLERAAERSTCKTKWQGL
ncbi:hypothetical protein ACOSQ4_009532 [Xanthoceras sorbifolium]